MDESSAQIRKLILRLVLGSLAVELLLAEGWLRLARGSSVIALLLNGSGLGTSMAAGIVLAVTVALSSRVFFSTLAPQIVREMFVPIFGSATLGDALLLGLLPGLGEEILFRGVLQQEVGIAAASLIFGLLHSGFSRRLLPYGLWATLVGALLGGLYVATGNLWGNIVAHAVTNAAGVLWIRKQAPSAGGE